MDTTCFPVALVNCGKYIGKRVNLKKYIKFCCCNTGSALREGEAIEDSKLPLEKIDEYNMVVLYGGIVTIMHPIFNLHSVFIHPIDNTHLICAVNSWLGPNEVRLSPGELEKFFPGTKENQNRRMWYISPKKYNEQKY